jgi:Carboxypeptidase regulatory-like domain
MTMSTEDFARPRWKRWLLNRFVLVPAVLLFVALAWNCWVVTHNHGIVAGRVVDAVGAPVAGAEVKLWVFNFTTFVEKASTLTKSDGTFAFANNPSHNIQVSAEKSGEGRSARLPIRLYFAGEDFQMKEPLRLADKG